MKPRVTEVFDSETSLQMQGKSPLQRRDLQLLNGLDSLIRQLIYSKLNYMYCISLLRIIIVFVVVC